MLEDLQFLFDTPITEQAELSPGYDDHASEVWLVRTADEEVVVRTSRMPSIPDNDFWFGCKMLFGIDPRQVHEMEAINGALRPISAIPVPNVIRKGSRHGRQYVVVEKLEGTVCRSFVDQPPSLAASLGAGLASIHACECGDFGLASGRYGKPVSEFHEALADTMTELVRRYYRDDREAHRLLPRMLDMLEALPAPRRASFILVDMDPTQFLARDGVLTGLVDTEVYVRGPRELDFVGLEYLLDKPAAAIVQAAYRERLPWPDLAPVRLPYRFFYRLLRVQGRVDWETWMNQPALF